LIYWLPLCGKIEQSSKLGGDIETEGNPDYHISALFDMMAILLV